MGRTPERPAIVVCSPISPASALAAPRSDSHRAKLAKNAVQAAGFKIVGDPVRLGRRVPTSFIRIDRSQSVPTPRADGLDHTELTITRLIRQSLLRVGIEVIDNLQWIGNRIIVPFLDPQLQEMESVAEEADVGIDDRVRKKCERERQRKGWSRLDLAAKAG